MKRASDLLTAQEAAAEKGVHVKSLYRAIREGRLKREPDRAAVLIRRKELDRWSAWGHRPPQAGSDGTEP